MYLPSPHAPMLSGPVGRFNAEDHRRREMRHERFTTTLGRAKRLRSWSRRFDAAATALAKASARHPRGRLVHVAPSLPRHGR